MSNSINSIDTNSTKIPTKTAKTITEFRKYRRLTQDQVAKAMNMSRSTYIKIETGKRDLSLQEAGKLASILKISIDDMLSTKIGITVPSDNTISTEKYKQIILNSIKYGSADDGKITKTKLAKLVYLADFLWYYIHSTPMSGVAYRKLPFGPVADIYFRLLDELEETENIVREFKGKSILFSLVENEVSNNELSNDELNLIKKICTVWCKRPTDDIVDFTHNQLPWQICRDGEVIPYGLITQEEPERVYGNIQLFG